jgi:hypothetical protein
MPLERGQIWERVCTQRNVHNVVLLIGRDIPIEAVGNSRNLVARVQDAFAKQEAGREFEVRAGGAHGHGDGLLRASGEQPNLEGFFSRKLV